MTTSAHVDESLNWALTTSVPLMRLDESGHVIAQATGTLLEHEGERFVVSVAHAVPLGTSGWALEIGLDPSKGMEVCHIKGFVYPGEFTRSTAGIRQLDLCFAKVARDVAPRYEHRTPLGLFDQRPRHIFKLEDFADPAPNSTYAFSGRVRHERHGDEVFVSDMTVNPGLKYTGSKDELHEFRLPVPHPGHDAFKGCSGSPLVSLERKVVGLVTSGVEPTDMVTGIAIDRCLPGIKLLGEARK